MGGGILLYLNRAPRSSAALPRAVALARACGARLTLLVDAPPPPSFAAFVANPAELLREADEEAGNWLREAAATVPSEVPVTLLARREKGLSAALAAVRGCNCQMVVTDPPRRLADRVLVRRWLGRLLRLGVGVLIVPRDLRDRP